MHSAIWMGQIITAFHFLSFVDKRKTGMENEEKINQPQVMITLFTLAFDMRKRHVLSSANLEKIESL